MERIYHIWEKWECYPAGFYETSDPKGRKKDECEALYATFLRNRNAFEKGLERVITEWKNSCEHYLSNAGMNRIAWLGQAALCISLGIPSTFRAGFNLLTKKEQEKANQQALRTLNKWLVGHGEPTVTAEEAGVNALADLY